MTTSPTPTPLNLLALALEDRFGELKACQLAALDAEYAQFVAEHDEPYALKLTDMYRCAHWVRFIMRHDEPHAAYLMTKALGLLDYLREPQTETDALGIGSTC